MYGVCSFEYTILMEKQLFSIRVSSSYGTTTIAANGLLTPGCNPTSVPDENIPLTTLRV